MEKVNEFLMKVWSKREIIDGKSFDDILQIEGIPLWWFFDRIFVPHMIPKQVNTFSIIDEKREINKMEKIKLKINSYLLKKVITMNERRKLKFFGKVKKKRESIKAGTVLFLSYTNHILHDGTVFRIQKLIDGIKEKNINSLVLFVNTLSSRKYKKYKHEDMLQNYFDKEIEINAKILAKRLYQKWMEISKTNKYKMLLKENFSYWPYLKYSFDIFFSEEFLYFLAIYYELSKKILITENIKVVVLTSQNSIFDKCMIAAAKKANIPLLRIQHGIGEGINPPSSGDDFYKLVFSDSTKNSLVKLGWPYEKVIVVGPVIFDEIRKYITPKKNKRKNILIATIPFINESGGEKRYYLKIENILNKIKETSEDNIILKTHPAEIPLKRVINNYKNCAKKAGLNNIKVYGSDLTRSQFYQLIQWCDVFVNFGTAAALEAMIIGRPVVTIKLIDFPSMYDWMEKNNLAIMITPQDDIKSAIKKALQNDENLFSRREEYIKEKCGVIDGKAHERVVEMISQLAKHGSGP